MRKQERKRSVKGVKMKLLILVFIPVLLVLLFLLLFCVFVFSSVLQMWLFLVELKLERSVRFSL